MNAVAAAFCRSAWPRSRLRLRTGRTALLEGMGRAPGVREPFASGQILD
jgi:hypothetical protein